MSDFQYTEQQAAAYGAYVSERARWGQVLGTTGKRKQRKPARVGFFARLLALFN